MLGSFFLLHRFERLISERQAIGPHADAFRRTLYADAQRHAGDEKQHAGEKRRPAPTEGMDCDPEKRRDQCAADRHCRADDGHRAGAQADEPTVGDNRRRVHETGGEGERDDAEVDDKKGRVAVHPGKENVADAGEQRGGKHHRFGAVAVDQVADDGRSERSFGARQGKSQRSRGAGEAEILGDGQKENREAVLMQAAAENAQRRNQANHAPAVVEAGEAFAQVVRAHGCRNAFVGRVS